MKGFKPDKRAADVLEFSGDMSFRVPFNERGGDAVERETAVSRDAYEPIQLTAAHGLDISQRFGTRSESCMYVGGTRYPQGEPGWCVRLQIIKRKPTRPFGFRRVRIWRNNFKKNSVAKSQQEVVRSHPRVFAAGLGHDPERAAHELHTGREVGRGDGDVVNVATRRFVS